MALQMGADGLELDVHLSADGVPVVIHDPTLDRTTNASGTVSAWTVQELRRDVDPGFRFHAPDGSFPYRDSGIKISTLAEVLDAFPDTPFVIEMKEDSGPPLAHATSRVVQDLRAVDRVIIGSFDSHLLRIVRQQSPRILTNFGNSEVRSLFLLHHLRLHRLSPLPGDVLMLPQRFRNHHLTTRRFRKASRQLGLQMHIWTVNDENEMRALIDLGVDGILSDYPDRLLRVLGRRTASSDSEN
jgi:glycerophosphoryl diester phosphodiesterase